MMYRDEENDNNMYATMEVAGLESIPHVHAEPQKVECDKEEDK
jgi:hypothetical protein